MSVVFAQLVDSSAPLLQPYIQWGFAGFAFGLTGVIVWLVTKLLAILKDTNTVIANNTIIIGKVSDKVDTTVELLQDVRDKLLSRPCIAHRHADE